MLTVLRDAQHHLLLACDWWLVDDEGRWEPRGRYVYVNQLEASQGAAVTALLPELIWQIASTVPWAIGGYWERTDRTGRKLHAYRRARLLREGVRV